MRNDERLRTIYEVMAPYIVRNEHNWRDYLAFASQFHKHSFDNILLVYAQDEDVSILATRKQWAAIGRNLIPRAKGVAVCVYHAALFLMASHPALFQKMDRYLCPEGIDFTKMMRKEEFEYDWMKITADAARNLFSWNSKCAATPFEISRMPAPAIRALFTACFIANGDYMVSVRKNDKGEKVFEIDDSAGKRREAFNLQMEQMMEAPGMEPD